MDARILEDGDPCCRQPAPIASSEWFCSSIGAGQISIPTALDHRLSARRPSPPPVLTGSQAMTTAAEPLAGPRACPTAAAATNKPQGK